MYIHTLNYNCINTQASPINTRKALDPKIVFLVMNCRCCSNSLTIGWPACIYKQCNSQAEVKHLWTTLQKRLHLLRTSLRMGRLWECHWVNFKQKHPHSSSSPGGLSQGWRPLFWELNKRGFISPGEQQIEEECWLQKQHLCWDVCIVHINSRGGVFFFFLQMQLNSWPSCPSSDNILLHPKCGTKSSASALLLLNLRTENSFY